MSGLDQVGTFFNPSGVHGELEEEVANRQYMLLVVRAEGAVPLPCALFNAEVIASLVTQHTGEVPECVQVQSESEVVLAFAESVYVRATRSKLEGIDTWIGKTVAITSFIPTAEQIG